MSLSVISHVLMAATAFAASELNCEQPKSFSDIRDYFQDEQDSKVAEVNVNCLAQAAWRSDFESLNFLLDKHFLANDSTLAQETLRATFEEITENQESSLAKFDAVEKEIPTLSPAFRWAQSLNEVFLEVKWATRFDSPACLDTFDYQHSVRTNEDESQSLLVEAMCRNDKTLMRYALDLHLASKVDPETAKFEKQSVGRLGVSMYKTDAPSQWDSLIQTGADAKPKPVNMGVWWDVVEKYEKELEEWSSNFRSTATTTAPSDEPSSRKKVKKVSSCFITVCIRLCVVFKIKEKVS